MDIYEGQGKLGANIKSLIQKQNLRAQGELSQNEISRKILIIEFFKGTISGVIIHSVLHIHVFISSFLYILSKICIYSMHIFI